MWWNSFAETEYIHVTEKVLNILLHEWYIGYCGTVSLTKKQSLDLTIVIGNKYFENYFYNGKFFYNIVKGFVPQSIKASNLLSILI